ncbi:hypothetical protein [Helicobacter colisuis]|uniref:Sugar transferase n=1 Tax=Helicobacter colisuis TaxID=2949739 RepID=A0ABT0TV55_9HELI|nr:hypothetical protein [Helicobacter colisuis]MCL9819802.1 hypothetical protein [Helicobacter colisuis]
MYFCNRERSFVWKMDDLEEVNCIVKNNENYLSVLLDKECQLECLKITLNHEANNEEVQKIIVKYYQNNIEDNVGQKIFLGDGVGEIIISFNKERLISEIQIFSLDFKNIAKISAFKRRIKGILVAGRLDAFGSRMIAFITAMYLSQKTGFKFGYTWRKVDEPGGVFLDDDIEIFEQDFIDKHSYKEKLGKGDTNVLCFNSIEELNDKPYKKPWGSYVMNYYIPNQKHLKDLDEKEYLRDFGKIFRSIPFKSKYKQAIRESDKKAEELGEFVAIHMRGGDSIYNKYFRKKIFSPIVMKYVFPMEVAIYAIKYFIEKENKKVVLFGADTKANLVIKEFLNDYSLDGRFFIASELHSNFNTMQTTIYEIVLMSKAIMVLANHSTYSKFAAALGDAELKNFNQFFSIQEIFDSILNYFDRFDAHWIQKSASCAYALDLACNKLNINISTKINLVNNGLEFDCNNSAFRVMLMDILMKDGQLERANKYLENILIDRKEEFIDTLLGVLWGQYVVFLPQFQNYFSCSSGDYPYISYIAAKISLFQKNPSNALKFIQYSLKSQPNNKEFLSCKKEIEALLTKQEEGIVQSNKSQSNSQQPEAKTSDNEPQADKISLDSLKQELTSKTQQLTQTNSQLNSKTKELNFTLRYGTAKDRIHNHLSYKLGETIIENSKSLLGYIRMPYVLSYIKEKHKQEQQQYQEAIKKNPNLKLPNLESYPDYKESLKEKECLTYKLGEAFIKANKTWYKGGYVKMWFEVRRLKERFKQ